MRCLDPRLFSKPTFQRALNLGCATLIGVSLASCQLFSSNDNAPSFAPKTDAGTSSKFLYVASGSKFAGHFVGTSAPSNTIVKFTANGTLDRIIADYTINPGDTPVDLVDYNSQYLLALIESSGRGRIDKVAKDGSGFTTFLSNVYLSGYQRSFVLSPEKGFLINQGSRIEKYSSNKSRVTSGPNAFVNLPVGSDTCLNSNYILSRVLVGPGGTIVFLHSTTPPAGTPGWTGTTYQGLNRIGLIKPTGYFSNSDCIATLTAPSPHHYPTAAVMHSSGKLLVAYSSATGAAPIQEIYSHEITPTEIKPGVLAYSDRSIISGVTSIIEGLDGNLLIASSAPTHNTIEEFKFDVNTNTLERVGNNAFIAANVFIRSMSALLIAQ